MFLIKQLLFGRHAVEAKKRVTRAPSLFGGHNLVVWFGRAREHLSRPGSKVFSSDKD